MQLEEIRRWTAAQATDEDRQAAARLADFPGVVASEGERELYQLTALIIASSAKIVPGAADVLQADLLAEQEAMWRVQLPVDVLGAYVYLPEGIA